MTRYLIGRAVQSLVSLLVVITIVFVLARLSGNPVDLLLDADATAEQRAAVIAELGLDKPIHVQYGIYLSELVQGDFGRSICSNRPTIEEVLQRLPATLQLGVLSMAFTVSIALLVGVYAAVARGRPFDTIVRLVAIVGHSVPSFWLGIIMIWIFAVWLDLLPSFGKGGLEHYILPAVTLGWFSLTGMMRLTRSSMIDVLGTEYIKLARLKGLAERVVIWKHALKNAALPVVTFASIIFVQSFLTGSIVVETVFAWPGVGQLLIEAVRSRDYPLVQTTVLLIATLYITANFLVDLLYAYLNPRIRYGS